MPCFLVLLALATPRVVVVLLWLFSPWFTGMFDSILLPVLGFIFVPTTLLWYSAVINWYDGVWGVLQIVLLIVAVMIDTGMLYSSRRSSS